MTAEPSRARMHWGDCASWGDEAGGFSCDAGLGATPPVVCLPPESEWVAIAPAWASAIRPVVVSDFAALGVRVLDCPGARIVWNERT